MHQNSFREDDDDYYGGFDSYDKAYDIQVTFSNLLQREKIVFVQNITQNPQFQQAVARSSHGRRPVSDLFIFAYILA